MQRRIAGDRVEVCVAVRSVGVAVEESIADGSHQEIRRDRFERRIALGEGVENVEGTG